MINVTIDLNLPVETEAEALRLVSEKFSPLVDPRWGDYSAKAQREVPVEPRRSFTEAVPEPVSHRVSRNDVAYAAAQCDSEGTIRAQAMAAAWTPSPQDLADALRVLNENYPELNSLTTGGETSDA